MGFLTDLVRSIRSELDRHPLDGDALARLAAEQPAPRDVVAALRQSDDLAVIAEVKRASPSAGAIADHVDPSEQARAYASGGAAAVSVLTEPTHFGGSLEDLRGVRRSVDLPILRKDFIVEEAQVLEARAAGADSILLITSCLDDDALGRLLARSRGLGMEPLVETHDDADLERALATDAAVVGVNARNLESLEVDVPSALARIRRMPTDRIAVLESGVQTAAHAEAARAAGAAAVLVGEALMRAADPAVLIHELRAAGTRTPFRGRPQEQEARR